ncbi:hypothetical protein U1Q18_043519, partial [Sarracenia purpurea var. burkii]
SRTKTTRRRGLGARNCGLTSLPEFRRHQKSAGLARSVVAVAQAKVDPTRNPTAAKLSSAPLFHRLAICDLETGYWLELPPVPGFPNGLPIFCHLVGVGSELVVIGRCDQRTEVATRGQGSRCGFVGPAVMDLWVDDGIESLAVLGSVRRALASDVNERL